MNMARINAPQIRAFGFGVGQNGPSPSQSPSPSPSPSSGGNVDSVVSFPGFVPTYPQPFYNYPVGTPVPSEGIPTWGWILGVAAVGVLAGVLFSK